MSVRPIAAAVRLGAPGGFLTRLGWRASYSHSIVAGGFDVMS
jgi:hypothetical protein